MSCLSATRNAVIVCLSGRRCHHEKRKCEQRRSGGGELLRSRCHSVFFLFLRVPQKNPQRVIPAEFHGPRTWGAELGLAIVAIRIAAMP